MSDDIVCYNCGQSLAEFSLPLSRRDMCPSCSVHVHVCRMCQHFDPDVHAECREDDAEEVLDKERVNFCEWFEPRTDAYNPAKQGERARARAELDALFGSGGESEAGVDADADPLRDAEDLFR